MCLTAGARKLVHEHEVTAEELAQTGAATPFIDVRGVLDILEARPPTRPVAGPHRFPCISLKSAAVPRGYQLEAAEAAARSSGFVVAPCAAGKTLIGLLVASLNGGNFLVLTTRYAEQWLETLRAFFEFTDRRTKVALVGKDPLHLHDPPQIVIATYSAFCTSTRCAALRRIKLMRYETLLLDEAHAAASASNMALLGRLQGCHVVALTATKVREDRELERLESRIGPSLVNIDRRMLVSEGHVAEVSCLNLVVEYDASLEARLGRQMALALNFNKVQVLVAALRKLSRQMHRTIVFCDDIVCLHVVHAVVSRACPRTFGPVWMDSSQDDRRATIRAFLAERPSIILISRTGDEALDVPLASAAVVFCNNWASRRQIVQRIGRISRKDEKQEPVFLVLLSDTDKERRVSAHRVEYMEKHGYQVQTLRQSESVYGLPALNASKRAQFNRMVMSQVSKRQDERPSLAPGVAA